MTRVTLSLALLLTLLSSISLSAQTRIDAGVAIGRQSYAPASGESPRVLTSLEVLARRGAFGLQVAGEYADHPEGALMVVHPDLIYRREFAQRWFALAGAGLTNATIGGAGHRTTWNAEAELGLRSSRSDIFIRVRQFDFKLQRFRQGDLGPDGPAVYVGARFRIHG